MSLTVAGAIAAALAVISLIAVPIGLGGAVPARVRHPDRDALADAGWVQPLWVWEAVRAAGICLAVAITAAFGAWWLGLAAAGVPSLAVRVWRATVEERCGREFAVALQHAHAALRSGASVTNALRQAAALAPPGGPRPLAAALRAFDVGVPLDVALRSAGDRARDRRVRGALEALALSVAERLPASRCAVVVGTLVERLVFEERIRDEMAARTSGLRAQVVLLACLVPAIAVYVFLTVPGVAETLVSPIGRFALIPLAAIFEAGGIAASRRVIAGLR